MTHASLTYELLYKSFTASMLWFLMKFVVCHLYLFQTALNEKPLFLDSYLLTLWMHVMLGKRCIDWIMFALGPACVVVIMSHLECGFFYNTIGLWRMAHNWIKVFLCGIKYSASFLRPERPGWKKEGSYFGANSSHNCGSLFVLLLSLPTIKVFVCRQTDENKGCK